MCKVSCNDVANGLLKSLNELGAEITKSATINRRVSKATIISTSKKLLERNIHRFYQDYPIISIVIQENLFVQQVIIYLFNNGIDRIHNWDDISHSFDVKTDPHQIENAICQLVEIDFITRTGYNGEVLFVTNPTLAHTLINEIRRRTTQIKGALIKDLY